MKLWAELTMSVQKEETKSSTDSDGAFTSALCKAAGTRRHLKPPPHQTTPCRNTAAPSPALLQSPIPTPRSHQGPLWDGRPPPAPSRGVPPAPCSPSGSGRSCWQCPHAPDFWPLWQFVIFNASLQESAAPRRRFADRPSRGQSGARERNRSDAVSNYSAKSARPDRLGNAEQRWGRRCVRPWALPRGNGMAWSFWDPPLWPCSLQHRLALRREPPPWAEGSLN